VVVLVQDVIAAVLLLHPVKVVTHLPEVMAVLSAQRVLLVTVLLVLLGREDLYLVAVVVVVVLITRLLVMAVFQVRLVPEPAVVVAVTLQERVSPVQMDTRDYHSDKEK
jgi:hypothetical protein